MAAKKKSSKRYGKKAAEKVEAAMHERKHGTLRSGRSKKKVTSKKQAIAIGLSEARSEGGKVPKNPNEPSARRKKSAKKTTAKKSTKRGAKTGSRRTKKS